MRVTVSKVALLRLALLVATGSAAFAASAQAVLKDQVISRPWDDSLVVVGNDSRVRAGMTVRDLESLVQRVADQGKALEQLRASNDALNRKIEEQAQKIANLERRQGDGGRSSDSQKGELDKLSRQVDSQKNELDKLSRSVSQLGSANNSGDRKVDDLQRRVDEVKRSVDDLRSRVK